MADDVAKGTRAQRRNQRRPVSRRGWIDGIPVDLFDLSCTGFGAGTPDLGSPNGPNIESGLETTLKLAGPDGEEMNLPITIHGIDYRLKQFGASFAMLSERDADAIEKLMFPRRIKAAKKAKS